MEPHVFYTGLIVIGLLFLLTAALIWAFFVATYPQFVKTVARNDEVDEVLNAELTANQRLLTERRPAAVVMPPIVIMRADEPDIVPMPHWLDTLPVRPVIEEAKS